MGRLPRTWSARGLLTAVLTALLLVAFAAAAHAALEEVTVFGPARFERVADGPQAEVLDFSVPRNAQHYLMKVQNGSVEQADLVSSAVISLNGVTVFKQNDFNRHSDHLESPVVLGAANRLEVKLGSIPSSHLTITLVGYYLPGDLDRDGDGYSGNEGDCDDGDALIHPGAEEVCDGVDNDCDGVVDNGCLTEISMSPDSIHLTEEGAVRQLTVMGNYVGGGAVDLTASSAGTSYASSAPTVASVSTEGIVTARAHGEALITAVHGGFLADAAVTVFLDQDGDGVPDRDDLCPGTAPGEPVDSWGCSEAQLDDDGDGVSNADDQCPGTPPGQPVDASGCALAPVEPLPEGSFGKQYEDLVPQDATIPAYDPRRFALVTGLVQDRIGQPLAGVTVTIHGLSEYGSALTDADGRFHLPMDGGATFTVSYEKAGLLHSHRQVHVPWNGVAVAETVKLIEADPAATVVTFDGNPAAVASHTSTAVTDGFGTRSTTLVLTGDNRAWGRDAAGNEVEFHEVTVRATEYDNQESMPAKLPPNTAYTYCAELSVDEAIGVRFEKPVVMYVDNFLGFDVGEIVPAGYYDRERAVWVPSENGVVVRLLDRDGDGVVDALDSTRDGLPNDLSGNGSFADEVAGLDDPGLYAAGDTYWRAEITHFTPWDLNWPFGPPAGAIAPNPQAPPTSLPQLNPLLPGQGSPCTVNNSYTTPLDRTFHEDIPIPGTGMALHYASNRVPGRKTRISIPASGAGVPESLKSILVQLEVAGRHFASDLPAAPNQRAEFTWDGLDTLGRPVPGAAQAKARIGFVYEAVYYSADAGLGQSFAQVGTNVTRVRARQEVIVWKDAAFLAASPFQGTGAVAEGWTLTPHHQGVRGISALFKGDGSVVGARHVDLIETAAGTGRSGYNGDGIPATAAHLAYPVGVAVDSTGKLYIAEEANYRVRKVDPSGVITTVAGTGQSGHDGDGIPAVEARLRRPAGIAVDGAGNLYIADSFDHRVRRVEPGGVIATVAGTGAGGYNGDGIPATGARLRVPTGVAVDPAGNLYIADSGNQRVRKVDPGGIITTVAGTGGYGSYREGIPAVEAYLARPYGVAVDHRGNLYIADANNHVVRRVDPGGVITTLAGTFGPGFNGDGIPAVNALLLGVTGVTVDPAGNLYIADTGNSRIRKVGPDGIISTVAGTGEGGYNGDQIPAADAHLAYPTSLAFDTAGHLYIADRLNNRIRKVEAAREPTMSFDEVGGQWFVEGVVSHVIGVEGRHHATLDLATGEALLSFGYDAAAQLVSITDKDGNTTVIQRGPDGVPTAVVSPDGLVTWLTIDANRHLTKVTYPDSSFYEFAYTSDGLMTDVWDPNGNHFTHGYDALGGLTDVGDPDGGRWSYSQASDAAGTAYTHEQTGELNLASYRERTDLGGAYTLTTTTPFGAEVSYTRTGDGRSAVYDTACGIRVDHSYGLDPQYLNTVLKGRSTRLPSGLTQMSWIDRTYRDTDSDGVPDRLTETVTNNGKTWTQVNDARGGTVTSTSPQGRIATAVYDPSSLRVLQLSVPGMLSFAYGYDARGRVESLTAGGRTTSLAYDINGYPAAAVTPEGQTVDYRFDVMGRLREEGRPDGAVLHYDYDPNGNLTVLTTPRLHGHRFAYTANDQRQSYLTPLSGSYVYTYDTERNLQTVRSPSGRLLLTNRYVNGLLQSTQTPEGTVTYSHDCGGRISGAAMGAESVSLAFDGPLLVSDTRHGLLIQALSYAYDRDFQLTSLHYAGGTETFDYDLDGLLVSAAGFTVHRNAQNGLPEAVTSGTAQLARAFNGHGELDETAYVVAGRPVFRWQVGERDLAGRITRKIETIGGETTVWEYLYDEAGRLTGVTKDAVPVETYSHDLNGNRTLEANTLRGIATRGYAYDAEDRVVTAGAEVYAFDADGFLERKTTEAGITTYTYSSRGELLGVDLPDGRSLTYDHDPLGRRVAKRVNGQVVEKYLWAGANRGLLAVYDGSDGLIARFRYADDRAPVTVTVAGKTYLLATDQLGTVRAVADTQGNVVKRIDYDTFGSVLHDSNPTFPLPLGFAGGLHDRDAGLVRFGARDYDPALGRWVAKDPIDFAGGDVVLYGYVEGDPVNFTDPAGTVPIPLVLAGALIGTKTLAAAVAVGGTHLSYGIGNLARWMGGQPTQSVGNMPQLSHVLNRQLPAILAGSGAASACVAATAVGIAATPGLYGTSMALAGTPAGQQALLGAGNFIQGIFPGPPPPTAPGYLGAGIRAVSEWVYGSMVGRNSN